MGRVYQPTYTKPDGKGGRTTVRVPSWYIEYHGADGKTHREKVGPNRRVAEAALVRAEEREARARHNLPDPAGDAREARRPIADLFAEYLAVLAGRDTSPRYRDTVRDHLDRAAAGCRWRCWADVSADSLQKFLGRLRDEPVPRGKRDRGLGLATLNGVIRSCKGFANWNADRTNTASPLRKVKPYPEARDRRRSKRVLTDAELGRLIAAAESAPKRTNTRIDGPMRAALYRVAAYTGLRASELASLTPGHFLLGADPPVVVVEAKDAKGKREEPVPLPAHLVAFLAKWFVGRRAKAPLWPGDWAKQRRQVHWLARDAKRAGLGPGVMLHGLKRKFVTGLLKTGANPDEVRRLARHRHVSTTLNYYANTDMPDLKRVADKLPPPG